MGSNSKGSRVATPPDVKVWLTLDGVPRAQWGHEITAEPQTIGRSQHCTIRIGDPTVSREHAVVWLKEGVPYIRDMHSINGARVNSKRISEVALMPGDQIRLGHVVLRVCSPHDPEPAPKDWLDSEPMYQVALASRAAVAAAPVGPTELEESALREDLGALYSLGAALGLCSDRSDALHRVLDWMREWLGVDQAVAVFEMEGRLRVAARSANSGLTGPGSIHWPTVRASLTEQRLVSRELSGLTEEGSQGWPRDTPRQVVGAWLPAVDPPGVIYGAWLGTDSTRERRCRELIAAAARVLGEALVRLEGGKPGSVQDPAASWTRNVEQAILVGGPAMHPVREFIRRAAAVDATVLLTGETGTGKELVARAIHEQSRRARRPFVTRNCAAFPEPLLENELFGHEPGAFTGAVKLQKGVFDEADHGTLILDEIADLPLPQQAKILHVIEDLSFQRVGGHRPIHVDVRIISATNRDLAKAVAAGEFRRDLYYRLQVLAMHLPPLRERPGDVRPLAEHFVGLACERLALPPAQLTREALEKLEAHNWPGNVRELRNTIDRAVILSQGRSIGAEQIVLVQSPESTTMLLPASLRLEDVERAHILTILASVGGNKAKAAALLGVDRSTLLRKLQRFDGGPSREKLSLS